MSDQPELPYDDDDDPGEDEDIDELVRNAPGASAEGDDEWEMPDWSPTQGLLEEGEHDGVLAEVKAGTTSGYQGAAKKPALHWSLQDTESGRVITKVVPLKDGNGIERQNVEFAQVFGVEAYENERGHWALPKSKLQAQVGTPCRFSVSHWTGGDGVLRDRVDRILPASDDTAGVRTIADDEEEPF